MVSLVTMAPKEEGVQGPTDCWKSAAGVTRG